MRRNAPVQEMVYHLCRGSYYCIRKEFTMAEKQSNKDRLKEITDGIEQGIRELFDSDQYRRYLSTMSRFHRYSLNNVMLIHMLRTFVVFSRRQSRTNLMCSPSSFINRLLTTSTGLSSPAIRIILRLVQQVSISSSKISSSSVWS